MVDAAIEELRDALVAGTSLNNVTVDEDFAWGDATLGGEDRPVIVNVDPETDEDPAEAAELVDRVNDLFGMSDEEFAGIKQGIAEDLAEFGLAATSAVIRDDLVLRSAAVYADVTLLQYVLPGVADELRVNVELDLDGEVTGVAISTADEEDDDYLEYEDDDLDDDSDDDDDDDEDLDDK